MQLNQQKSLLTSKHRVTFKNVSDMQDVQQQSNKKGDNTEKHNAQRKGKKQKNTKSVKSKKNTHTWTHNGKMKDKDKQITRNNTK